MPGLAGVLAALALSLPQPALADVFNSQTTATNSVASRLDKLEAELKQLRSAGPAPAPVARPTGVQSPGTAAPGGLTLPTPPSQDGIPVPPEPSAVPETEHYVILGRLNGKTLVKQGAVRYLLTDAELAPFMASRAGLAVRRLDMGNTQAMPSAKPADSALKPAGTASRATASDNAALAQASRKKSPPPPPPVSNDTRNSATPKN